MYCDRCGTRLEDNAQFCRACGKPMEGVPLAPPQDSVAGHIRLLGILWIAISAFRLVPSFVLFGIVPHLRIPPVIVPMLPLFGLLFLGSAVFGFIAGWGLLTKQAWARTLSIILGCLALLDMPFGTALGIYTLWVLLPERSAVAAR